MSSPRAIYLAAIADCLRRIRASSGYNTDAGLAVTLEPAPVVSEDGKPVLSPVWERQARATDPAARNKRMTTVAILAKVPAAYGNAQGVLDMIVQDVETCLRDQQFRFPAGYDFPQYQSAEPIAASAAAGWVGAVITVSGHIPIHS
ncbi:MAG: hypothetical protein GX856_03815 [Gammaproteobacteria bacterium]|jgi:hypothetical protein|nr:hypothetical protein [Gammaproteobacteria bacterium]